MTQIINLNSVLLIFNYGFYNMKIYIYIIYLKIQKSNHKNLKKSLYMLTLAMYKLYKTKWNKFKKRI